MAVSPRTFLLTGATGFLGKVLLEELLRRRVELGVEHVFVVIRPLRGLRPDERFRREVAASACFAHLPHGWTQHVTVVDGNVEHQGLGIRAEVLGQLSGVTHMVHAAASVQFDLPLAAAAAVNISASLHAMALAQSLPRLQRFVYVSTAYVTPARHNVPILERLVDLPLPASELYGRCLGDAATHAPLLERVGLPNTYTLTKVIAEHLLVERRGHVPLTIVRPSIITASRVHPFPGWIDSAAGYAGFVMAIGAGHLRALVCDPDAKLDLIPVDEVSHRIVHACEHDTSGVIIRQAAVGAAQSPTVAQCWDSIQDYFNVHRVDQRPTGRYLGPRDAAFSLADTMRHRLPLALARTKSRGQRRQAEKRIARIAYLNEQFSYFTTHTFDFQSAVPMDAAFDGAAFTETVNRGVYRHLFNRHDRTWILAGRARAAWSADLQWARRQPRGSALLRGACWMASKVFRRSIGSLTVDVPSFERALAERPAGSSLVLTPSHRSYLDFVLCTYLAFARPDLLPIPHFAATTDFARIPILGRMLRSAHAFYLERGRGKDPELAGRVEGLLNQGHTLAFFVEGARSRDGEFLQPKRGLLRCLQGTGRTCTLLPIAISYERIPERAAFDRELAGLPKQPMRLGALLAWVMDAWRGRIDLGDIHIACGAPVILDSTSDVHTVSREVIARLRDAMIQDDLARDADDVADSKPWSAATAAPVMAGVHAAR